MNILVANNFFVKMGGSETFCYSLIQELLRLGHKVEYFTLYKGVVSDKIENDLGVSFMSKSKYDLILANHFTCVRFLAYKGKIIQTCHGIFPSLEQPSIFADGYVSVSHEVAAHLSKKGIKSEVIYNGIDCERFRNTKPINGQLKNVLSMCQSDEANSTIKQACDILGVNLQQLNKNKNPKWEVENMINEVDLIVGLGRSAYEAMACGRTVVVFDKRDYSESFSDGYLNKENLKNSIINNCSGRFYKKKFEVEQLVEEFKKYNPEDCLFLSDYAFENLNIKNQVQKYLELAESLTPSKKKGLYLVMCFQFLRFHSKRIKRLVKKEIINFFKGNRELNPII